MTNHTEMSRLIVVREEGVSYISYILPDTRYQIPGITTTTVLERTIT